MENSSLINIEVCPDCKGSGVITIPAEQVYSQGRGTYIRDEYDVPCLCQSKVDDDYEKSNE